MMDLFTDEMLRDPFPLYEQLRDSTPVLHVPSADLWMLLDYESVKRALNDPEVFSSRAAPPGGRPLDWMIFHDPPRHTKLRALVSRAFTPRTVAGLEPRIRELSRELLDPALERGEMDLVADYAVPLPLMVIAETLGIPLEDRPRFRGWSEAMLNLAQSVPGGEAGARAEAAFGLAKLEMRDYVSDLLERRRAKPADDLLSRLLQAEVDGERLGESEILDFFQLLLLAGSETTTNLIANALLCFVENPDPLARVRSAPELLPAAIEEVLRYRSPVQVVFRQTRREVRLHGETIPEGKLVLVGTGAANRDPRQFPQPGRFEVAREPNAHVGFGHGIHFCLGAGLARLEARIALTDLLTRMASFRLASDEPWPPRKAFHVHGPSRLPIRFEPARRPAVEP